MKQTIIITGGGSGLGLALAKQYSGFFNICLIGRTESKLQAAVQSLEAETDAFYHTCDVTNFKEVQLTLSKIFSDHTVHMLINNAGVGIFETLQALSQSDIKSMIETNVYGTIFPTQAAFPHFQEQGFGKVMNVISTAGLRGKVNESVYCASKFAVRGFTESLVKEWEGTGIYPTAVYMGGMDTPFWDESDHIQDKSRLKSPDTVAELIVSQDDNQPEIFIDR